MTRPGAWFTDTDRPSAPSVTRVAQARLLRREILDAVEPGERVDVDGVFWRLEARVEGLLFVELEEALEALREDGAFDMVSTGVYERRGP